MSIPEFPFSQNSFFYSKLIEQRDKCAGCSEKGFKFFKLSDHFEKHIEDDDLPKKEPKGPVEDELHKEEQLEAVEELPKEKTSDDEDALEDVMTMEVGPLSIKDDNEVPKEKEPDEKVKSAEAELPNKIEVNPEMKAGSKEVVTILDALKFIFEGRFLVSISELQGFNNHINFCYGCADYIANLYKLCKEFSQISLLSKSLLSDMVCFEEIIESQEDTNTNVLTFDADLDMIYAGVEFSEGAEPYTKSEMESFYQHVPVMPVIQVQSQMISGQLSSIYQTVAAHHQPTLLPNFSPNVIAPKPEAIYACPRCQKSFTRIGLVQHMARKIPCELKGAVTGSNIPIIVPIKKKKKELSKERQLMIEKGAKPCFVKIVPISDLRTLRTQLTRYRKKLAIELMNKKKPVVLACYICQTEFNDPKNLRIHGKKKKYTCKFCCKNFCLHVKHKAHQMLCGEDRESPNVVTPLPDTSIRAFSVPSEGIPFTPKIMSSTSPFEHNLPNFQRLTDEEQFQIQQADLGPKKPFSRCTFCFEEFQDIQDYKIHMRTMKFRCRHCFKNFCGFQEHFKHQAECTKVPRTRLSVEATRDIAREDFNKFINKSKQSNPNRPRSGPASRTNFSRNPAANILRKGPLPNGIKLPPSTQSMITNFIARRKLNSQPIEVIDLDDDSNKGDDGEVTVPVFHDYPHMIPTIPQESPNMPNDNDESLIVDIENIEEETGDMNFS